MGLALVISLGLCFLLMAGLMVIDRGDRRARGRMTPEELRKYEVDPDPEPDGITDENVHDVINHTIETGEDHPLLAARKARYVGEARKGSDIDWPQEMPCDCGGTLRLVSIEDGYVCDNALCVTIGGDD